MAIGITIKSHKKERLLMPFNNPADKVDESGEKVCLIDDDNVEPRKCLILQLVETHETTARNSTLVMRDDIIMLPISVIAGVFDDKNAHADRCMTTLDAQNAGGLPRKHRSEDDVERHLRIDLVFRVNGH